MMSAQEVGIIYVTCWIVFMTVLIVIYRSAERRR